MSETDDVTSAENTTLPIDVDEYLQSLNQKFALMMLPTLIFLGAIFIAGIIGNVIVLYIFWTKFKASSTKCFVLALALFDLLTCSICIPGEFVDILNNYTFENVGLCKVLRFANSFSSIGSGVILVVVASDRFKKICRPLLKQMTMKTSRTAVVFCCLFSFAVSWPAFILYGRRTVRTEYETVNGTDCSTQDRFIGTLYPLSYNGVQFLIFITATSILFVLYGLIWRKLSKQKKYRKNIATISTSKQQDKVESFSENETTINVSTDVSSRAPVDVISNTQMSPLKSDDVISNTQLSRPKSDDVISNTLYSPLKSDDVNSTRCLSIGQLQTPSGCTRLHLISRDPTTDESSKPTNSSADVLRKRQKYRADQQARRTTSTLFVISLVFVLSFLPHLGLMAARAIHKVMYDSLDDVAMSVYNLFLRSFFIHSAVNPIIYGYNNSQFRQECKAFLVKQSCKRSDS